jgi:hypothetical protein
MNVENVQLQAPFDGHGGKSSRVPDQSLGEIEHKWDR